MRCLWLFLLSPLIAVAASTNDNFNTEFFISQGVVHTSDNSVAGSATPPPKPNQVVPPKPKSFSLDKREIGGMASYQVNDSIDLRGMVVSEKYGQRYSQTPRIEYALVDLHHQFADSTVGTRIGRVKHSLGMFNEKRINPYLRDMDFPPQGLYRDQLKQTAVSGDGIQLYFEHLFESSILDFEVAATHVKAYPVEDAVSVLLGVPAEAGTIDDTFIRSFHVIYKLPDAGWIIKYDYLVMDVDYNDWTNDIHSIPDGTLTDTIQYLSAIKYFDSFDVTGEIAKVHKSGELADWMSRVRSVGDPYGFNAVVRYRVNDSWTLLTGYNVWFSDITDTGGYKQSQATGNAESRYYQKDLNFGVKYKLDEHWMFKTEYHIMQGTNILSAVENPAINAAVPKWNMFSASVTYKF